MTSAQLGYKPEVPWPSLPYLWLFAKVAYRTQGNMFASLSKNMIKDNRWREQLDEDILYKESLEGLWARNFCLQEVGACDFSSMRMCSLIWKLSEPHAIRISMEALSCRHYQSLTPFLAPLHSLENGKGGWKFQASNHGLVLVFLVICSKPGAFQEHTQSTLIRKKGDPGVCIT